jgi:high-affinity iron transporter
MIMLLTALVLTAFASPAQAPPPTAQPSGPEIASARRVAATANLAAEEYRLGVRGGQVIAAPEVEEARLFLAEARRNASRLPMEVSGEITARIDSLLAMVNAVASPDSIDRRVSVLVDGLARRLGITLDEVPTERPSLARGREVYQANCASCHGASGRGDGPVAPALSPRPSDLANPAALLASSPLDFYRRITVGTAGTAMAPYEHMLSSEDRWAVALYTSTLRLPRPSGRRPPEGLALFGASARMTDADLLASLGVGATLADVAAVRILPAPESATMSAVFTQVRRELDSAYFLARGGHPDEARAMAMDAYITFERVERELRVKDPALTARIEAAFESLRNRAGSSASTTQLEGIRRDLAAALERAERTIADRPSGTNLVMQSFVILVREGLEAILVIGALMAFLVKTGNAHRRRDIHLGVGAAIALSLLTAAALETVFVLSRRHQEGLEGAVMLLASATLFYVSYWLLSKMEVAKWNRFVRSRMEQALTRGSALALGSVAFLAVYREGFETVLFYKALAVSGGGSGAANWLPISGGILAGAVVLAIVYVAINRFGVRLPLKPFFGITGTLLYYMAFVFAGKGIAELQVSGAIGLTPVTWGPRIPALGVYPTVESLGVQGGLLALALLGLAWILLRRGSGVGGVGGRVSEVRTPDSGPPIGPLPPNELLRSIDRIETDLAEVRVELERMRERVRPEDLKPSSSAPEN